MTQVRVRNREQGFSLIEVVIAMSVLAVGLLGLEAAMVAGLNLSNGADDDIIARQKAAEAIESVFTARDTRTITWARLRNVAGETGTDNGVFTDGLQNLTVAGADGLVGTADDQGIETVTTPGANGLFDGGGDDVVRPLTRFKREITIRTVNPTLRTLRVRITYFAGPLPREYVIDTLISSYA